MTPVTGRNPLNGHTGEMLRYVIGLALAALVAYFTAQTKTEREMAETKGEVAANRTLEQAHFEEIQRTLKMMDENNERRLNLIQGAINRIEATGADRRTGEPYAVQRRFQQ